MAAPLEVAAVAVGAGALLLSLAGTLHAARWAAAPVGPATGWRPRASVIVPVKGEHPGLAANARAIAAQDYPAFEVLLVVDAKDDACVRPLEQAVAGEPRARVVLTDPAIAAQGWATGKIAAQLTGVALADPASEVLVFADADARPPPRWLASLVAPLEDPQVGGVTGYRWYVPATRPTLGTAVRDAWNAVGLDALTLARFRFLWGGSMACRREDLERSDVRARWRTAVSEDVGLTRAIEALGLRIAFAPGALVASPEDWGRAEAQEWIVRQTALTRVAMPGLYAFAAAVYALSLALLAVGAGLALAWPSALLGWSGLAMLAPVASAAPRAWLRERMVLRALGPAAARPARERAVHLALGLAMPLIMLAAIARAHRVERIPWRGRTYALAPSRPRR